MDSAVLYQVSLIRTHFTAILCPPDRRGLPAISDSGGPRIAPRRAPNREGQSAAMKWVRINEIWY